MSIYIYTYKHIYIYYIYICKYTSFCSYTLYMHIATLYRGGSPAPASRDGPQEDVSYLPFLAAFFIFVSYNHLAFLDFFANSQQVQPWK